MKILITGASGRIGARIAQRLQRSHEIWGLDIVASKTVSPERMLLADISNPEAVHDSLCRHNFDAVVHAAAITRFSNLRQKRHSIFSTNCEGTKHVVHAAESQNIPTFVLLSTIAVYGETSLPPHVDESHSRTPTSWYGASKVCAENEVERAQIKRRLILRLAPVVEFDCIIDNYFKRIGATRLGLFWLSFLVGTGRQRHSFCSIDTVQRLLSSSFEAPERMPDFGIVNVADDRDVPSIEIVSNLREMTRRQRQAVLTLWVPRILIDFAARIVGLLLPSRRDIFRAVMQKLSYDNTVCTDNLRSYLDAFTHGD